MVAAAPFTIGCRYRTNEAIAVPRMCLNKSGFFSRIPKRVAQFLDGVVQSLFKVNICVGGPNLALQFFSGDQFSMML